MNYLTFYSNLVDNYQVEKHGRISIRQNEKNH